MKEDKIHTTKPKSEETDPKLSELNDRLLRAQADFDNYRKRVASERQATITFANAELIGELLPVLDNFKRAATHAPQSDDAAVKNWIMGVQAVERQLEDILKSAGVVEIETIPGHPFDPTIHEAIAHEPSDQPEDTVVKTIEIGYLLGGKVLRPAKVSVSSGKQS